MSPFAYPSRPLVIAHRGASAHAPENTLAAFRLALEQGADGVELDVQLSADGEVVICHDSSVERTTDGHGLIAQQSLAQLKQLDAGAWLNPAFRGERLPTLAEVFEGLPGGIIDVELKPGPLSNPLPQKVAELITRFNLSERVIVTSFLPHYLSRLHQLLPQQAIGLLELNNLAGKLVHTIACAWLNLDFVLPHYSAVKAGFVEAQNSAGRQVMTWTVDDPEAIRALQPLNIAGFITNDPVTALAALERA